MANYATHSAETKAQVIAALLQGQGLSQIAREYGISVTTVYRWKTEYHEKNGIQKPDIDALISESLRANLAALTKMAEVFTNEEYLQKQDASSAAVLFGVVYDKTIRILEAANAAEGANREQDSTD